MRMKQKTKSIVTALLLGALCAVTLSAVITVPDWETARADLLIGMTAVAACTNMNFNGFVKLGGSAFLDKLDGIHRIVQCGTIDSFSGF